MAYFDALVAILLVQGIAGSAPASQKAESAVKNVSSFGAVDEFARNGDFPYQVSIQKDIGKGVYQHVCSGVLISDRHVLTAARCYSNGTSTNYLVKAGSVSQKFSEPDVQTFFVNPNKSVIHEKYDAKKQFSDDDVALLTLMGLVKVTEFVKPLKLPSSKEQYNSSLKYVVTGWGLDALHQTELKFFKIFVMDNAVCREILKLDFVNAQLSDNQVCSVSPSGRVYTQDGDSGSPLVRFDDKKEAVLVGIASAVTKTSTEESKRLIFTRVPAYIDWIEKNRNGASSLAFGYLVLAVTGLSVLKNLFD